MRAARVDANQREIVKVLNQLGASVVNLSAVGKGVPDLAVGFRGHTFFMEIKDGKKPLSQQRLTPFQIKFRETWNGGEIHTVNSVDSLLMVMKLYS